jgi:hypothetical protein
VSVPDVVLPVQFFPEGIGLPDSPEKRLMFAVLLDAITQLRQRDHTTQATQTLAREAAHWVRDHRDDGFFSFANVCGVLGLEPTVLASGLLAGNSLLAGRVPLRHRRTSRLRVTPRRRVHRQAAAVGIAWM